MASDPVQTSALFEKHKPTHVIHLAAIGASLSVFLSSFVTQAQSEVYTST